MKTINPWKVLCLTFPIQLLFVWIIQIEAPFYIGLDYHLRYLVSIGSMMLLSNACACWIWEIILYWEKPPPDPNGGNRIIHIDFGGKLPDQLAA